VEASEPPEQERPLALATILVYAAPMVGVGFLFFFVSSYLMKFATDVLLIPPVAMGAIFGLSRLWDAFTDPLAGYWSDRTRTRLGRRRPWLLAGALPAGIAFVAIFSPPRSLSDDGLLIWMAVSVVALFTALTVLMMPHDSLGAELSGRYHDRNRIFGWRRIFFGIGAIAVFGALAWIPEQPDPRQSTPFVAALAAIVCASLFILTGVFVRERPEHQGRGADRLDRALADVARNPHARILIATFFLQQLAVGSLVTGMAYYTDYIIGDASALGSLLGTFFVASVISVPFWVALGSRYDKKSLALFAMAAIALVLSSLLFLGEGDLPALLAVAALGGAAGGCLDVVLPSIQADVIDYDEHRTGERKEGLYFAVWALAAKSAAGVAGMLFGVVLQATGFVPNAVQGEHARLAILAGVGGLPVVCYLAGALCFLRFRLSRGVHADLRAEIEARARRGP
jgi:GPH family glycoside/pentoside/hexuronide:cation symporter